MTDSYCWTPQRKILTSAQSQIRALPTFGLQSSTHAGTPLQTHTHPGCLEVVFLIKGFQCYEAGGQLFNLAGYDIFVSYPDEPHSSGTHPEAVNDIIWFQIDLTKGLPFFGLDHTQAAFLAQSLQSLPRLFRGDAALKNALTEAFFHLASPDPLLHALGQQTLLVCLYRLPLLARQLASTPFKTPEEAESVEDAIVYIHDHITEPILLEDIAACCHLSLSRFKSKFKEKTGTTPRSFINHLKIEQAKLMLRQQTSVTATALALGFDTPNYFSTIFKKYTGISPSRYRRESSS